MCVNGTVFFTGEMTFFEFAKIFERGLSDISMREKHITT